MATRRIDTQTLTGIADAIRAKTGDSSAMTPAEMVTEIESIQTGGVGVEETEYVLAQDWSKNVGGGNTKNFFDSYCNKGNGIYYFIITNNAVVNDYKAISAIVLYGMLDSNNYGVFKRTANNAPNGTAEVETVLNTTTWTFLMSVGSNIHQTFIPKGAI